MLEIFLRFWKQLSNCEETTRFSAKDIGSIPIFVTTCITLNKLSSFFDVQDSKLSLNSITAL